MTWDDTGYSMWDEVKEFYKKAWAQRIEPFALAEFMDAVASFNACDVRDGLRYIYRNQERALRPSIKQVAHAAMTIREENRRKGGKIAADEWCKWCDDTKIFFVTMYIATTKDLPQGFVFKPSAHKNMRKLYRSYGEYLVRPEAAKKKGLCPEERGLWCDRCQEEDFNAGRAPVSAIRPFVRNFRGFYECYEGTESQLQRVLDENPPLIVRTGNSVEVQT